ncbi:putative Kynurenine formamidase [Hypsibius exemplaris]|uniref:Kynurenine formamidase n=1 Tax=Hypsibius exemplaris TaxID=2072580 RepID=A0A1W0W9L7_HYPEX|nr:putative Kynurenine formamidase [Hypsibius exemplaris]
MGKLKNSEVANHLYSPCYYHNQMKLSPEQVLDRHYAVVKQATEEVRREYFWIENIRYGSTFEDAMDVYSYQQEIMAGRPLFVYVHGVYGLDLSKDVSGFMGKAICENGGVLVVLGHRISTNRPDDQAVSMTNACGELGMAMEMILDMADRLKSSGILMCGHSWGAHLLSMMLSLPYSEITQKKFALIKAVWLVGGVFNLKPLSKTYHNDYLQLTKEEITNCSPVQCVKQLAKNFKHSKDTVLNICVAQYDSPVFEQEAEEYFVAIKKQLDKNKRVTVELTQFLGRDHFEVVESLTDINDGFTQEILASMAPLRPVMKEREKYSVISLEREILPLSLPGSSRSSLLQ